MTLWTIAATLWVLLTGMGAVAATVYSNFDYGFAIVVPNGLAVERDQPPRPNHGFSVTLGQGRRIFVFANYDVLQAGSAAAALRQSLSYSHPDIEAPVRRTGLAGLPAAEAGVSAGASRGTRVGAFRTHDNRIAVIYEFYLDTDATHARRDDTVFRQLLRGFTLQPLP